MTSPPPEAREPAPTPGVPPKVRLSGPVGVVAVVALSAVYVLGPPPPLGGPVDMIGWDKLGHLFGFTAMTLIWALSWRQGWLRIAVPLVVALVLETSHALQPERMLSLGDVVANLIGVGLGLGLAARLGRRRTRTP